MTSRTLKTYQLIWTHRDHLGDWQYAYDCTWSDGTVTREISLPWGQMEGAVEVGKPVTAFDHRDIYTLAETYHRDRNEALRIASESAAEHERQVA